MIIIIIFHVLVLILFAFSCLNLYSYHKVSFYHCLFVFFTLTFHYFADSNVYFFRSWRWSSTSPAPATAARDLRLHAPGLFRSRLERPTPHEHVHIQVEGQRFEALKVDLF